MTNILKNKKRIFIQEHLLLCLQKKPPYCLWFHLNTGIQIVLTTKREFNFKNIIIE